MVLDFCGDSVVDHCGVRIPLGETLSPLSTILLIACCWWATKCVEAVIRWSLCSKIVLSCVQTQCMWYGIQLLAVFLHVHACRPLTEDTIQEIPNEATEPFCTPQNEHCYVVSRAGQLYSQRYQQPGWKLRVTADWVQLWLAFSHVTGSAVVPSVCGLWVASFQLVVRHHTTHLQYFRNTSGNNPMLWPYLFLMLSLSQFEVHVSCTFPGFTSQFFFRTVHKKSSLYY